MHITYCVGDHFRVLTYGDINVFNEDQRKDEHSKTDKIEEILSIKVDLT